MRDGVTHDYRRKRGVEHSEVVLPEGLKADWAYDRSALWNAAEASEKRKDARVAREFEVSLPHELTEEEREELTRTFARDLANRHGAAVDFAIHSPHGHTDNRNHHAHILMTTRKVLAEGLGEKTSIERENQWLLNRNLPTSHAQLKSIRQAWEQHINVHLARSGHSIRVDSRSHRARGIEVEPTQHVGVHATQMERQGKEVSRPRISQRATHRNAELIKENPEHLLGIITAEKSVFDRQDVARGLHRYIDDADAFQSALAKVMASPALIELRREQQGQGKARYSTREMLDMETEMAARAIRMHEAQEHVVKRRHVEWAIAKQDKAIKLEVSAATAAEVRRKEITSEERKERIAAAGLTNEQRAAIEHVTGAERVSLVVGYAGAGKSKMLNASREAWEAQGYKVYGAALSGKAAEGLQEASGIESRTLTSWEFSWENDKRQLERGDVLVIDEAGMTGSKQLSQFVAKAEERGAKLVLVGDHEQLQAIGAGAPFRAIAERVGSVELHEIRRQIPEWQREASVDFASHRTRKALDAYAVRGAVHIEDSKDAARALITKDYMEDLEWRPEGSRVALSHRRDDVRVINEDIRAELQERGALAKGTDAGEVEYRTRDGARRFAAGDRIVFLENNRELGVKNGMLGTVDAVEKARITATLDGKEESLQVPIADYRAVDHGYATTIHKAQGATVDRTYVLASTTMDRHLTYVAMTRHRDGARLYASKEEFGDVGALASRLSRSGAKETTLDYLTDNRAAPEPTKRAADDWWKRGSQPVEEQGDKEKRLKAERERLIAEQVERHRRARNDGRDRER